MKRSETLSNTRRRLVAGVVSLYLVVLLGVPMLLAVMPAMLTLSAGRRLLAVALAPTIFVVAYAVAILLMASATKHAIIPGRFARDLGHPVYGLRRLYGLCVTMLYYSGPIYQTVLAIGPLRRFVLRGLGYRGALDLTLFPDTWIRDLPLLDAGHGVYLSNKATIGTNMCLRDGTVLVDRIRLGPGSIVGHLAMIAPGVVIGNDTEISVGAAVGIRARVGDRSIVGPRATVFHGASVGAGCVIGGSAQIGHHAVIHDGIVIPFCAVVEPRAVVRTQSEADALARGGRASHQLQAAYIHN